MIEKLLQDRTLFRRAVAASGVVALAVGVVSTYWDIASHVDIGRDRFITPPHLGMYASVTFGLALVTAAIYLEGRHDGASVPSMLRHPFKTASPGLAAAAAGMTTVLAAAPLDNAWHELFGIDVTIWSPPHLLAIAGIAAAALGLTMLVAPATGAGGWLFPASLGCFLAVALITTGEYEFNGPQYRIAFHPALLVGLSTLVLVAASRAGGRWNATIAALSFELIRLVALLWLVMMNRSLAFVPLLVPAALAIDVTRRALPGLPAWLLGGGAALVTFWVNQPLLEAVDAISWVGDDLAIGLGLSIAAGFLAGALGERLGLSLSGGRPPRFGRGKRGLAAASLLLIVLAPAAAAHDIGGDRGTGTLSWTPEVGGIEQPMSFEIEGLSLNGDEPIEKVQLEAWRAEHRIPIALGSGGGRLSGEALLPAEGPWLLVLRVETGDDSLLSTTTIEVDEEPAGATARRRFTLGLDSASGATAPPWLEVASYLVTIAMALLLIRGVVRALGRLQRLGYETSG